MARRTYLPELRAVLMLGCKYIRRWRPQIEKFLPPENHTLLDGVLEACDALVEILDILIIVEP